MGVKGRNVTGKKYPLYTRQKAMEASEEEIARLNKRAWSRLGIYTRGHFCIRRAGVSVSHTDFLFLSV